MLGDSLLKSVMKGAFHGGLIGVFWMTGFYAGFKTGFQIKDEEYKRKIILEQQNSKN